MGGVPKLEEAEGSLGGLGMTARRRGERNPRAARLRRRPLVSCCWVKLARECRRVSLAGRPSGRKAWSANSVSLQNPRKSAGLKTGHYIRKRTRNEGTSLWLSGIIIV
jgi:hypothetical protein